MAATRAEPSRATNAIRVSASARRVERERRQGGEGNAAPALLTFERGLPRGRRDDGGSVGETERELALDRARGGRDGGPREAGDGQLLHECARGVEGPHGPVGKEEREGLLVLVRRGGERRRPRDGNGANERGLRRGEKGKGLGNDEDEDEDEAPDHEQAAARDRYGRDPVAGTCPEALGGGRLAHGRRTEKAAAHGSAAARIRSFPSLRELRELFARRRRTSGGRSRP